VVPVQGGKGSGKVSNSRVEDDDDDDDEDDDE
jgi:hypothetical protein